MAQKPPRLTTEDEVVDMVDAEFASWTLEQQTTFANVLCRLLPALASESDGLSAVPMERVVATLKAAARKLAPKLLFNGKACGKALGHSLQTRGHTIRNFCVRVAQTIPELQRRKE